MLKKMNTNEHVRKLKQFTYVVCVWHIAFALLGQCYQWDLLGYNFSIEQSQVKPTTQWNVFYLLTLAL